MSHLCHDQYNEVVKYLEANHNYRGEGHVVGIEKVQGSPGGSGRVVDYFGVSIEFYLNVNKKEAGESVRGLLDLLRI